MGRGNGVWERLAEDTDFGREMIPGQMIVEIAGNHRVLIENHFGVSQYSKERIGVKVKTGLVCVCGSSLELTRMTKEQLVITGRIDSVNLIRRDCR